MVRTSDYFAMLGVDAAASSRDVAQAHQRLRSLVPAEVERDPSARLLSREIVRSLDQARDVLTVPELRAAYLRHLHR